jgi:hypothetical protein
MDQGDFMCVRCVVLLTIWFTDRFDEVFSFAMCHSSEEHTVGDVSSLFMETLSRNYGAMSVGKSSSDINIEKDDELPATFTSSLKTGCNR